jgi:hypothetical protein
MLKTPTHVPVPAKPTPLAGVTLPIPAALLAKGQEQSYWCWAACVQLDLGYRGRAVAQCALANSVPRLGGGCCGAPLPSACDGGLYDGEVDAVFHEFGIASQRVDAALSAQAVKGELGALGPVGVGLSWGHMVMLYGWNPAPSGDLFLLYDPLGPANGTISHSDIVNYGGSGSWVTSWKKL